MQTLCLKKYILTTTVKIDKKKPTFVGLNFYGGAYGTRSLKHKCLAARHSYGVRCTLFANTNSLSNLSLLDATLTGSSSLTSAYIKKNRHLSV